MDVVCALSSEVRTGFFDFYAREVLPATAEIEPPRGVAQEARA